ncbi:MAG: DUF4278 domain-containing protein [Leptolyngbyaceae cyanobacterium bins.349]|nr:DUF4278 domain-containing protein [Leptolyngbyaceae cyanobacterium bins.349]
MQLVYRGSTYTPGPTQVEMPATELIGKYRGAPITFATPMGVSQPQAIATLTYRGASYLRVRG